MHFCKVAENWAERVSEKGGKVSLAWTW
jgi:hypothetical protein